MNPGYSAAGADFTATLYTLIGFITLTITLAHLRELWLRGNEHTANIRAHNATTHTTRVVLTDWYTATSEPADNLRATMLQLRATPRPVHVRRLWLVERSAA